MYPENTVSFVVDTGIANEKDWGISLLHENVNESGINEDGSTWYRESGEDDGENGYRCRWTRMGGQSYDGTSEWKETVFERSIISHSFGLVIYVNHDYSYPFEILLGEVFFLINCVF